MYFKTFHPYSPIWVEEYSGLNRMPRIFQEVFMMAFKAFGSGLLAATQPEDQSSTSFPTFGMGLSGGLWASPAQPPVLQMHGSSPGETSVDPSPSRSMAGRQPALPGVIHPADPHPTEYYPMGRPPLTPEQTRRIYARQLGVDPSRIDPNGMRLMLDEPSDATGRQAGNGGASSMPGHGGFGSVSGQGPVVAWGQPGGAGALFAQGIEPGHGIANSWTQFGNSEFVIAQENQSLYAGGLAQGDSFASGQGGFHEGVPQGISPGGGFSYGTSPAEQGGQPGGEGSIPGESFPPGWNPSLRQPGNSQGEPGEPGEPGDPGDEGNPGESGDGGEGKKPPKEAPSPHGTTLVTTTSEIGGVTVGDHAALYIRGKNFLYDPGGTFRANERGSGATFDLGEGGFQAYINYHKAGGSMVYLTKIPTTPSEEAEIVSRAEQSGNGYPLTCAVQVSTALGGVCGIKWAASPSGLRTAAEGAMRGE